MCVVHTFWDECPNYALIQSSEVKAWKASLEAVFLSAFGKGPYRRCITEQGRNKKHTNYPPLPTPPLFPPCNLSSIAKASVTSKISNFYGQANSKLYNHIQQAEKPCSKYAHTEDVIISQNFFLCLLLRFSHFSEALLKTVEDKKWC